MNTIKSLIAVALAGVMLNGFVVTVLAHDVEAGAAADAEVTCETGTYGQNVNCKAHSHADAKVLVRHDTVNTGLDSQGIALALGTVTTGAAAVVAKFRFRK